MPGDRPRPQLRALSRHRPPHAIEVLIPRKLLATTGPRKPPPVTPPAAAIMFVIRQDTTLIANRTRPTSFQFRYFSAGQPWRNALDATRSLQQSSNTSLGKGLSKLVVTTRLPGFAQLLFSHIRSFSFFLCFSPTLQLYGVPWKERWVAYGSLCAIRQTYSG